MLECNMSNAYRFVFECPNGHNINLQRKCTKESLLQSEALRAFRRNRSFLRQTQVRLARQGLERQASPDTAFQLDSFAVFS